MESLLPFLFMAAAAVALLVSISFLWSSLRTLLGGEHELYVVQSGAVRRRMELLEEKEEVLKSLKDLEFERDVGKVSDEDFKRLEVEFRARAKRILRALDDDLKEHREKAQKLVASELKQAAKSRGAEAKS